MGWISKIATSADLATGMMERVGSEFSDAILESPETSTRAFAAAVYRCAGCSDQAPCAQLQAENAHLDHAPGYCRNFDLIERTRRA